MSRTLLFDCSPRDPATGTVVPVRLCWKSRQRANYLGVQWLPAVSEVPRFETSLGFDGRNFGALPAPQVGQFGFMLGGTARVFASLVWKNAPVTIRLAPWPRTAADAADGDFAAIWTGQADAISATADTATVTLIDAGQALRVPLLAAKFGASGNALLDSADAVMDRPSALVPMAWGKVLGIPGLLVERLHGIWLFSGRAATSIEGFYDGGAMFGAGTARANLAALVAGTPVDGTVDYCLNDGGLVLARPSSAPHFPFTADMTCGSAKAADIAQAAVSGRTALTFKAGVIAAYNAVQPADAGLYLSDEMTVAAALDRLFAGLGSWWKVTSAGTIDLRRYAWGSPALTVPASQRAAPDRKSVVTPTRRRTLGFARNNKLHGESDIAGIALADSVAYADGTPVETLKPSAAGATRNVFRGIWNSGLAYALGDEVANAANDRIYDAKGAVPAGTALTSTAYWDLKLVSGGGSAGANAINARLTNPLIMVPTAADGSGGSYAGLTSQIEFYDGTVRKDATGLVTFALVGSPAFASVSSTGAISTGDWGAARYDLKIDATYAGTTYRTTLALVRSLQGSAGPALTMTGGGTITYTDGVLAPAGQSRTLAITRQNASGAAVWTTVPAGIALTGAGDSRTLAAADMGSYRQVTVRATVGAVYDEDTVIRAEVSTAEAGATFNLADDELNRNGSFEAAGAINAIPGWIRAGVSASTFQSLANTNASRGSRVAQLDGKELFVSEVFLAPAAATVWVALNSCVNLGSGGTAGGSDTAAIVANIQFYDAAGTYLAQASLIAGEQVAGALVKRSLTIAAPAGSTSAKLTYQQDLPRAAAATLASSSIDYFVASSRQPGADVTATSTAAAIAGQGALATLSVADFDTHVGGATKPDANADVTANAVPLLTPPAGITIKTDYTGAALTGQLPRALKFTMTKGGTDVSAAAAWAYAIPGFTFDASAGSGSVAITGSGTANGKAVATATYMGKAYVAEAKIDLAPQAAPVTPPAGSSSDSVSVSGSVASGSYVSVLPRVLKARCGTAGTINLSAPLAFDVTEAGPAGLHGLNLKWMWRIVGGSFADFGSVFSETTGSRILFSTDSGTYILTSNGAITANEPKTGLSTTGTVDYEFDLLGFNPTLTSRARYLSGTASAVAA